MARTRGRPIEIEDLFRLRVVTDADMAPDGSLVVFSLRRMDLKKNATYASLYAVPARGGRLRRLTRGDHVDGKPRFSPDGNTLAFLGTRDKARSLWLLPMDGGEPKRLTFHPGYDEALGWAPDGGSVLFVSERKTYRDLASVPRKPVRPSWRDDPELLQLKARKDAVSDTLKVYVDSLRASGIRATASCRSVARAR